MRKRINPCFFYLNLKHNIQKRPDLTGPAPLAYEILLSLVDGDLLAVPAHALKADSAADLGEQGIVAALANVDAGMDMGAALADQDAASQDPLPVGPLGAKALGVAVAAVLGGADALFMGKKL